MENEGSYETDNEGNSEPIETSVVSIDTEMIIVQPGEFNQAGIDLSPNHHEQQNDVGFNNATVDASSEAEVTPGRKKRKRSLSRKSDPVNKAPPPLNNDDDDGSTCSICLDAWESKGDHRLIALKCGHLFGESCIKRWILECSPQGKSCPTCKSKVKQADIRPLYAKRVVCADKTEEYRLQDLLDAEKKKNIELHSELSSYKLQMAVLEDQKSKLEIENKKLKMNGTYEASQTPSYREIMYKMSKHRDIEISREGGCQALTYGRKIQTLIVSQKSSNRLFPGYGVRFIDTRTLQLAVFFRMSAKLIRDLSLNVEEELLAAASSDENAYIYSVRNRTSVATIRPLGDAGKIWTTSFDKVRPCNLHIGSQQGIIYTYDTRNYSSHFMELKIPGDDGPVIFIESIPISNDFRYGGFIVCKLKSLWFYEYNGSERIEQTKLAVDGPFVSVSYDEQSNILLITTRTKGKCSQQLIVAYLMKTGQTTVLRTICTIPGSSTNPKMQRNTQITIGNVSIVANYLQDKKLLGLWNARTGTSMQKLQVEDGILDMCPMNLDEGSFLATINEKKCRIFQLNPV